MVKVFPREVSKDFPKAKLKLKVCLSSYSPIHHLLVYHYQSVTTEEHLPPGPILVWGTCWSPPRTLNIDNYKG